jgi:UDP-GlcNAc:undecaprenyl-phosphate/decaprenyl-phosphate GlcNAc-1-phosphate transferase
VHPSLEYMLVCCIAATGSLLLTPIVRRIALRWGAVAHPRDRDVHAVDTPRLGGVALYAAVALSIIVAHELPTLHSTFADGSEAAGVLLAGGILIGVGALDDKYELDWLTKLAAQVTAAGSMVLVGGVQLAQLTLPWNHDTIIFGRDSGAPLTILFTVLTINAVNFIDGLDGLAAGVTAICALAFFSYTYHLAQTGNFDVAAAPTLLAAALAGACIGFLPHNFAPARIFMGDSGSMFVGLVLAAIATTASTRLDPQALRGLLGQVPLALSLLIPLSVLALPLVDFALAVVRRLRRGHSPFAPDREHLHHRLMEMGHSHRRAVLLLYFWAAVIAFGGVGVSFVRGMWLIVSILAVLVALAILLSMVPKVHLHRH